MLTKRRMRGAIGFPVGAVLLVVALARSAGAGDWTVRLEPTLMDAYGHDQHVLSIHQTTVGSTPQTDATTGVNLDTDSLLAFRGEVRYVTGTWAWGADVTVFYTDQGTADRTAAGDGSTSEVTFDVAGRSFTSSGPDEVLFYGVLEDTSLQTWTVDLYALRTLTADPESALQLQFGLRTADFDNDYRAVVGVQEAGGRRLDASSNYDRMLGPLLGVVGRLQRGRSTFEGAIAASVLLGSVELTSQARDFTGPLSAAFPVEGEVPNTYASERFKSRKDVAIPVTDLRLGWTYRLTGWLALGGAVTTSTWWNVPVPPGVVPTDSDLGTSHESTIVFLGLAAVVEASF